jgi:hypothetical protein
MVCNSTDSCENVVFSSVSNTQNTVCQSTGQSSDRLPNECGTITNNIDNGFNNKQNTACQSSSCTNSGTNTNVYANSVPICTSNGPDTTTFCQPGRPPIVIPNK